MNGYSIIVLIMAAVTTYMGFYYMTMYLMHSEQPEDLPFALSCLGVAANDICNAGLYNAATISEGMAWERWNFVFIPLFSISLIWFVQRFTKSGPARFLYLLYTLLILSIPLAFVTGPWTITAENAVPHEVHLGSLIQITYNQARIGTALSLQILVSMALLCYAAYKIVRYYFINKKEATPILIGLIFFFIAAINDYAVTFDTYEFIYLTEFSFFIVILCMNYSLLGRFSSLYNSIKMMNVTLEKNVESRTAELNHAMRELEVTNEYLMDARDQLWGEMELAKKIQTVLLPREPRIANHDIAAYMAPASEVGGDYYDIINAEGFDWVIIGDVSGHGVPAGLIMMMVQTAIQTEVREHPSISPSELLKIVNRSISNNIAMMIDDKYVTITALSFSAEGGIRFSGLHQDLIVYRESSRSVEFIPTDGIWLSQWDFKRGDSNFILSLGRGDVLLLYTDGITEATYPDNTYFGYQKLGDILLRAEKKPASVMKAILDELEHYTCKDDVTMVVIKKI